MEQPVRGGAAVTPWNGEEAMPAPTHINGLVVVAAIKVPTRGSGQLTHQWYVTCEDGNGQYVVWHSALSRREYIASHGDYDLGYTAAVEVMLQRAGYLAVA